MRFLISLFLSINNKAMNKTYLVYVLLYCALMLNACSSHHNTNDEHKYYFSRDTWPKDLDWAKVTTKQEALDLIKKGKDLNPPNDISILCYTHNLDLKELLLQHGANPNHMPQNGAIRYSSMPEFHYKINYYHPLANIKSREEGELLLKYGGNIPPYALAQEYSCNVQEFYFDHGANLNLEKYNTHILRRLTKSGPIIEWYLLNSTILRRCKKEGVNLSAVGPNPYKKPYIFYLGCENQIELIKAGVDPNIRDPETGNTILLYNLKRTYDRNTGKETNGYDQYYYRFYKKLIKLGADPTLKDNTGRSAISYVWPNSRFAQFFIKEGCDPNEVKRMGEAKDTHMIYYMFPKSNECTKTTWWQQVKQDVFHIPF